MDNKELVAKLVKLQVLCLRYVERNTTLKCNTYRDMNRIIMKNKLTCTYEEATENLYENISKYCKNSDYLMKECLNLKDGIESSNIKTLRFGLEPQKKFTKEEKEFDTELIKRQLFYINGMVGIKDIIDILGGVITESAVKQACQQERLLNTKKVGKTWLVNIQECRAYWNIPDEDESHLYKDWVY